MQMLFSRFSVRFTALAASKRGPALGRKAVLLAALGVLTLSGCVTKFPLGRSTTPETTTASGTGAQTTAPTGLRGWLGWLAPYSISVQQGNFVSSEMLTQLKVGMTPEQVRFALGTPLLIDAFHAERWDYIFRLQRGNGELTSSRVTVFFKDNRVASFEGGDLPTETEYLARIAGAAPAPKELPALTPPSTAPSAPAPK